MENDHSQNSLKLRQIIESLMREKDELNQRLIKVNHEKLPEIVKKAAEHRDFHGDEEATESTFYLWNCGILMSTALPVSKYLLASAPRFPQFKVEYIVNYAGSTEGGSKQASMVHDGTTSMYI